MTTLQEKIAVMQHFADGGDIEVSISKGIWHLYDRSFGELSWDWHDFVYRIAITKPSINWDHVSEKYNYLAVDENGNAYLYEVKPSTGAIAWKNKIKHTIWAPQSHASFKPGTCDWKDSLISRFDG